MRRGFVAASIVGILSLSAGCSGPDRGGVRGEVTLNGKPVGEGSISFLPADGTQGDKVAAPVQDGRYEIPPDRGPRPGRNRVEISWARSTGHKVPSADPGLLTEERREAIPPRYNKQSTLVEELRAGANTKDFQLTAP